MKTNQILMVVGVIVLLIIIFNWNKIFGKKDTSSSSDSGSGTSGRFGNGSDLGDLIVVGFKKSTSNCPSTINYPKGSNKTYYYDNVISEQKGICLYTKQ